VGKREEEREGASGNKEKSKRGRKNEKEGGSGAHDRNVSATYRKADPDLWLLMWCVYIYT